MPRLSLHGDRFHLRAEFDERHLCKEVPGYRWEAGRKAWSYPAAPSSLRELRRVFPNLVIDESAVVLVEEFKTAAQAVAAAKAGGFEGVEPIAPMPLKLPPMEHQVLGFNIGIQLPNVALLMEMGTGKTVTAIAITGRRYLDGYVRKLLVVAPTSVVPVWPAEFAMFADFPFVCEVFEGEAAKRNRKFRREELGRFFNPAPGDDRLHVLVTNYESLANTYKQLAEWGPDSIIADESQRIKNPQAGRSKAMHYLGEISRHNMILTGTPVTQGPHDLFSQYKFLEPSVFGKVFATFRSRYLVMGGFENREITDYRHLEDLERRAHSIAYRVRKAECLDLPGAVPAYRLCDLEPKARKLYDSIADEAVAEIEGKIAEDGSLSQITVNNVLTKLLRLQQIAGGYVQDDDGEIQVVSQAKMKLWREELDDDLAAGAKVVVFARFRPEIQAITKYLNDKGIDHSLIWGDTKKGDARGEEVRKFQEDDNVRVFVAQIQTAGLGITLTAGSVNHFYSCSHSFGDYDQALARTDRKGQTIKVTNKHLLADNTCDIDVLRALRRKRNVAAAVVDGMWRELIKGRSFVSVDSFDDADD